MNFEAPCSISGLTPITASIAAHPSTGGFPEWISIASNMTLSVNAPAYGASNDYFFSIRFGIYSENIDEYVHVTVYK